MSYAISGYKFKTYSFLELNKIISDLQLQAKVLLKSNKQEYFQKLLLDFIMSNNRDGIASESLYSLNVFVDLSYFDNKEDVKAIKSMNDVMKIHYKEQSPEQLCIFTHKDYDFMMINNTLDKSSKLLDNHDSDLLEESSFSTYCGESHNTEALKEADDLYYKELKIKLGLQEMDEDEFSEYCDDNDYWESKPSELSYAETKKTWEIFTQKSFYINKHSLRTTILDEKKDFEIFGLENFGFDIDVTINNVIDSIKEIDIKREISTFYLHHSILKLKNKKFNSTSDYLKQEREIRNQENFDKESIEYFRKTTRLFKEKYGETTISEFSTLEIY